MPDPKTNQFDCLTLVIIDLNLAMHIKKHLSVLSFHLSYSDVKMANYLIAIQFVVLFQSYKKPKAYVAAQGTPLVSTYWILWLIELAHFMIV